MSDSPAQLRAKAEYLVRRELAKVKPEDRSVACRLLARAYLVYLLHLESPQAAAEAAYQLADEFAEMVK